MSTPNTMAQQSVQHLTQQQQQRPQFSQQNPSHTFSAPNSRTNSFNAASPQMAMNYVSSPPAQFSPQSSHSQLPPSKRPRLSPDAPSPFSNSNFSPVGTPQAASPVSGIPSITTPVAAARPGLMPPPQRPLEKTAEDRSYDDILSGTGINIEEEARNLTRQDYYSLPTPQSSFQTASGSFQSYRTNSFSQPNGVSGSSFEADDGSQTPGPQTTSEEIQRREHERADWEAGRHSQHELWDMFLYGGTLNDRVKKLSSEEHLVDPQTGVLVNTQRNAPPPVVRVNALEGGSKVIDRGQSILDTKDKAERLADVLKLVSLAAKSRLSGLLGASARMSFERREHSAGKIPDEWAALAIPSKTIQQETQTASPTGNASLKRTFSQANSDTLSQPTDTSRDLPKIQVLDSASQTARGAEDGRLAKRTKRSAKTQDNSEETNMESEAAALAAAIESEKKTTKKERKLAESKISEQQAHKSTNEAARLATSGLLGSRFGGKKSKSYAWMTGTGGAGGGGAGGGGGSGGSGAPSGPPSAVSTPVRGLSTSGVPTVSGTSTGNQTPAVPRARRFQDWDEDKDPGVQARDVLLILESDGKAAKSFVKGCSMVES